MGTGFTLGIGVFLAWALTREVDPANNYSAFIAAALSLLHYFFTGESQFLLIAWVLLILRVINGISGKALTIIDLIVALSFTIYLSISNENSLFLIILAITTVGLYNIRERKKTAIIVGILSTVLYIIQLLYFDYFTFNTLDQIKPLFVLMVIASIVFAFFSKFLKIEKANDDKNNQADPKKIRFGQIMYSLILILLVFFSNATASHFVMHLSVIGGSLLYFIGHQISIHLKGNLN
ncbi:hypothetical protein [Marinilactibacillus kalidii]|uniref:hypothetical protein n=1 Tax=Marinilactibacillus kalidii TaxID=2820274 RepID=UPI001ABE756E|nr:hypothetical protein [Marinilactibacillus kalidii]